jgi:hypothetical protein
MSRVVTRQELTFFGTGNLSGPSSAGSSTFGSGTKAAGSTGRGAACAAGAGGAKAAFGGALGAPALACAFSFTFSLFGSVDWFLCPLVSTSGPSGLGSSSRGCTSRPAIRGPLLSPMASLVHK